MSQHHEPATPDPSSRPPAAGGRDWWRSLEELARGPAFDELLAFNQ